MLALEDLKNMDELQVKKHIANAYYNTDDAPLVLEHLNILVAYESVGSWGCDSSSFFLFRDRTDGELYTVEGGHCSCRGFEDQWRPVRVTYKYLTSDKFYMPIGGYDNNHTTNIAAVKEHIKKCLLEAMLNDDGQEAETA